MAKERNALQVGIVTSVVILAFFVILIWISKNVGGDMKQITIRFKSSAAMPTIVPGSAVLVGGQRVGKVVEARLEKHPIEGADGQPPREGYFVVADAEIRSDLVLRKDCEIVAEGPPLGGDGLLKIELGTAEGIIESGEVIEGAEPGGFGAVLAGLNKEFDETDPTSLLAQIKSQLDPEGSQSIMAKVLQSLDDINVVTASLSNELGSTEKTTLLAKLHAIVDNINMTTGSLRRELGTQQPDMLLGKIHIAMDAINDDLSAVSSLIKNNEAAVSNTLQHVEKTAANIAAETDPAKADSLMASFKQASTKLNEALNDINVVTDTTRQVVVLNRENINKLLVNFKESSDHIKTGVKYVLRHPWRLLNEPSITEIKQQAIFDAARSFAEAATRIDDASAQLRALAELHEGEIPGDDPDLARIQTALKETQEKYSKAEEQLWRELGVE